VPVTVTVTVDVLVVVPVVVTVGNCVCESVIDDVAEGVPDNDAVLVGVPDAVFVTVCVEV